MASGSAAGAWQRVAEAYEELESWRQAHGYYRVMYGEVSMASAPDTPLWSEVELRQMRALERKYREVLRQYERERDRMKWTGHERAPPGYLMG
jgi:hypothetical protein